MFNDFELTIFKFEKLIFQLKVEELVILLHKEQRAFGCGCFFCRSWVTFGGFPVCSQSRCRNIRFATRTTNEGSFIVVESLVKLQVDKLCKTKGTFFTGKGLLSLVQTHVCLKIGCRTEPLLTFWTRVGLFTCKERKNYLM